MILSDRTIREQLAAGRIEIEPLDDRDIQPSSVDLHIDRYFRVFRNHTMRVIDVKEDQEELTELIEVTEDDPFILHPGEFVLGSTLERVRLPDDLVARLEGKSSLGRLGLLIHSSLPGDEPVVLLREGRVEYVPIGEIVRKQLDGMVVGFDRDTFEVDFFPVTGWYEGPPDKIFEVRLASGRHVRVTAGHSLFTLDRDGGLTRTPTLTLAPGTRVAIPREVPSPLLGPPEVRVLDALPNELGERLVLEGPTAGQALQDEEVRRLLASAGYRNGWYAARGQLPLEVGRLAGLGPTLGPEDSVRVRGGRYGVPAVFTIDEELAWLLGIYVAEGYRRRGQVVISNTDPAVLDRAQAAFGRLGLPVYRREGVALTCSSIVISALFAALGMGGKAVTKRLPAGTLGWPRVLQLALLEGLMDGDGSRGDARDSYWTCSPQLAADVLTLMEFLGRRAAAYHRQRGTGPGLYQVAMPKREHKLLTAVPLPDPQLTSGALLWDEVVEVRDTGTVEPVFDLEVNPRGRRIENFLAGAGGVFVSNTAGFVDAGWDGQLTLELSNVANLPITLYPGMKIGQISFLQMTTEAEHPYGSGAVGSKYQHQVGPRPSRYFENFRPR